MKVEYVYPFISTTFWGISIVGAKIVGEFGFSPIQITFIRFAMASVIFLPLLMLQKLRTNSVFPKNRRVWLFLFGLSITGVAVNNSIFYYGLELTDASVASLIVSITPLLTMIFAVLLLGESFSRTKLLSVVLGMVGVALIIGFSSNGGQLSGNLLIVLALVLWGSSFSFSRLATDSGLSSLAVTGWSEIMGTMWMIPVILTIESDFAVQINGEVIFWFVFMGILSSVIAYIIHYQAIAVLGASTVAPSTNIIPFSGALTAWILLGDPLTVISIVGAILVIIGVILVQREKLIETEKPTPSS